MDQPRLVDLISFWLAEHAPNWSVQPQDWPKGAIGAIHFKSFGPQITIFEDRIVFDSVLDKKPLEVMAANPILFDLLSNRLYILEQGFQKALDSRIETAKREHERKNKAFSEGYYDTEA